jgi:hypothetical protein
MPDIVVTITCDWEGEKLEAVDLTAMKILNQKLVLFSKTLKQAIPITHFICPAYFTRTDGEEARQNIAKDILKSGAIKKEDEIAAHVHCWKSLSLEAGVDAANFKIGPIGVNPNSQPAFVHGTKQYAQDTGYTVPFGIYAKADAVKFLNTTVTLIGKYLGQSPVSFRSGMWVTCDVIFEALAETPLRNEASGIPFNYMNTTVRGFAGDKNLVNWNVKIWGNAKTIDTDPQYVQNHKSFAQYSSGILGMGDQQISEPKSVSGIVEVPDTGTLIPITNQSLMNKHIDRAFEIAEQTDQDVYISLGFHQEDCGQPAFFNIGTDPLTKEEKEVRLNGLVGAIAHLISKSIGKKFPVEFIKKDDLPSLMAGGKKFAIPTA